MVVEEGPVLEVRFLSFGGEHRNKIEPFRNMQYLNGKPTPNGGNTGGYTGYPEQTWEQEADCTWKLTKWGCMIFARESLKPSLTKQATAENHRIILLLCKRLEILGDHIVIQKGKPSNEATLKAQKYILQSIYRLKM